MRVFCECVGGVVVADGQPAVSPKGEGPGCVRVADSRTLLIPERKGNKLVFSLQNILSNPKVGLIFLRPGTNETLRVSGKAELLDDSALCDTFTAEMGHIALYSYSSWWQSWRTRQRWGRC